MAPKERNIAMMGYRSVGKTFLDHFILRTNSRFLFFIVRIAMKMAIEHFLRTSFFALRFIYLF